MKLELSPRLEAIAGLVPEGCGCLADIAPTLIELMGLEQPAEMTGKSLLIK